MRLSWFTIAVLVLAACGSSSGGNADAAATIDGPAAGIDAGAAGADAGPTADAAPGTYSLTCESGATTFPPLDKRCGNPGDCAIAYHQNDCCGSEIAIGVASGSLAAFNAAEADCAAGYPACGCAAQPTKAEDGRDTTDGTTIKVACQNGQCTTYVP